MGENRSTQPAVADEGACSWPDRSEIVAVMPGSFDPITLGHLELAERASRMFAQVVIAVGRHPHKRGLFAVEERMQLIEASTTHLENVRVDAFSGLVVDYCRRLRAQILVRGLRDGGDLERETPMAQANRLMYPGLETVYLLPKPEHGHVSSSLVREIAGYGAPVDTMVSAPVAEALAARFAGAQADDGAGA